MSYCPSCGAENESDAVFCEACGSRLDGPLPAARASKGGGQPGKLCRRLLGGALIVSVAIVFGAAAYSLVGRGDDGAEGGGAAVDHETATAGVKPTVVPTAPPTATVPALAGYPSPEEAIGAFLVERGVEYAGDCDTISLDEDIGSYCSMLWEERPEADIYGVGLAFSEGDTWLLLEENESGWAVVDWAELVFGEPPPW